MQPMLAITASHPGILYINGHFAGELSPQQPLLRPAQAYGPVYLDYRPLEDNCRAMARRIVFSGGIPLAESAEEAAGTSIVIWPGNVTEIELTPPVESSPALHFSLMGRSFQLERQPGRLLCEGRRLAALPEGAEVPALCSLPAGIALSGKCKGGAYLLTCDGDFRSATGFLQASRIDTEPDGRIRALVMQDDIVGHASLEIWRLTENGLVLLSSEPVWAHGSPQWPQTAVQAARAAVEAALAGLYSEAEGYLTPSLRPGFPMEEIRQRCDLCVEMKYVPPDARPSVGLLRMDGAIARVEPMYFHAVPSGGPQGPFQIDCVELG